MMLDENLYLYEGMKNTENSKYVIKYKIVFLIYMHFKDYLKQKL